MKRLYECSISPEVVGGIVMPDFAERRDFWSLLANSPVFSVGACEPMDPSQNQNGFQCHRGSIQQTIPTAMSKHAELQPPKTNHVCATHPSNWKDKTIENGIETVYIPENVQYHHLHRAATVWERRRRPWRIPVSQERPLCSHFFKGYHPSIDTLPKPF